MRGFEAIPPGPLDRLGDADTRPGDHRGGLRSRQDREWRPVERKPVLRTSDAQSFAKPAGTGAEEPLLGYAAAAAHQGDARRRLQRADEHGAGRALRLAD